MKIASRNALLAACLTSLLVLSACAHRADGLAHLRQRQASKEAILAKDPSNYQAIHDLAIIDSTLYLYDAQTSPASAPSQKEKALAMIHAALKQAPLPDKADLGIALERLGCDQEALAVYDQFLQYALHAPPGSQSFSNALPVLQRDQEANWRGLITVIQTHADLLRKKLPAS
ncbi:MAG TPA: hypothetical protein VMP11_07110 [Verrucomicrobiae bacterium]|nr:hypothetical protein [Verrucomicrobiae bacterium]